MLYDICFLIFAIFYLPALILKGKLHKDFLQRFGLFDKATIERLKSDKGKIWIQAVSVGEVALCRDFIPRLKERYPNDEIVLSTITRTGNDLAKKSLSGSAIVIYFPLDLSFIVRKVAGLIRPKLYIMIETEIWPNLLKEMADKDVPSILINGRISDRSFGKYELVKPFLANTLKRISRFCMQSDLDAERIIGMGAPKDKVTVTGTMKFDVAIETETKAVEVLRESLGLRRDEELLVAGSTHLGEDVMMMELFHDLLKDFPGLKLLIAPRHVGDFPYTASIVEDVFGKSFGFTLFTNSGLTRYGDKDVEPKVFILGTIGHLKHAYAMATIVFVGGSLVRYGGHNPIEPAVFEKPVIFGPHMFNFRTIAKAFVDGGAAIRISDKKALLPAARDLLNNADKRRQMGENAKRIVLANRGATERNMRVIQDILANSKQVTANSG